MRLDAATARALASAISTSNPSIGRRRSTRSSRQIAKDAPRGSYPRSFSGEQEYWTVVGVDGDREEGLLGEDGALEVGQGAFSIEPFLLRRTAG